MTAPTDTLDAILDADNPLDLEDALRAHDHAHPNLTADDWAVDIADAYSAHPDEAWVQTMAQALGNRDFTAAAIRYFQDEE